MISRYLHHFQYLSIVLPLLITAFSSTAPPNTLTNHAPSWNILQGRILETSTGKRLRQGDDQNAIGRGPPNTNALLRLFDAKDDSEVRVTLFRDSSAWCPYCQKTWLLLEEKRIPYRVQKVPMNAYGDKPAWYTRKVDGGKLPAIELDGKLHVESLEIMMLLDYTFSNNGPRMIPPKGTKDADQFQILMDLEKELQRDWFSLVFYPVDGEDLAKARQNLFDTLHRVDDALSETKGPWFLGGDDPSIVDLQFVVSMERLVASALYWKGLAIRQMGFKSIDTWLEAFEARPNYIATKSDYYNHIFIMPSQNGPGYSIDEAKGVSNKIYGLDDAWKLPLKNTHEPLAPLQAVGGDESARHEAAYRLIFNSKNITYFACRGAGEPGRPAFHAELADPYAEPDESYIPAVDICLRHVALALIDGIDVAKTNALLDLVGNAGSNELRPNWYDYIDDDDDEKKVYYWNELTGEVTWTPPTKQLDTCLMYLRDRVGVPRDMGQAAAMQLRSHLNWAIDLLQSDDGKESSSEN